ncbi:jg11913 [Pararge aegeria aegeria]|uniref:Jg11913 protein n=1 Tax=Pararge aegeria aegeria TaxID=348720 RepID=A0A8S4QLN1_9NEOP|nr:jg11913 [Pararge aegeria aegeria]
MQLGVKGEEFLNCACCYGYDSQGRIIVMQRAAFTPVVECGARDGVTAMPSTKNQCKLHTKALRSRAICRQCRFSEELRSSPRT